MIQTHILKYGGLFNKKTYSYNTRDEIINYPNFNTYYETILN